MYGLDELNFTSSAEAHAAFLRCCGSVKWARKMVDRRPFNDIHDLLAAADHVWNELEADDWLEAFGAHPKIGEKKVEPSASSGWAEQEQEGASHASKETQAALLKANHDYEEKFGYIFIVCATGKSADEMLVLLNARMTNDSYTELRIAADEQRRITQLRLNKLLSE